MKLSFPIAFCLMCFCFLGCDPIYNNKSNPLSIKADSSISRCLKVEGLLSVFPDLKKVYVNSNSRKILKDEILVIIFHDIEDLLAFKNRIGLESNKSINTIKSKLKTKIFILKQIRI